MHETFCEVADKHFRLLIAYNCMISLVNINNKSKSDAIFSNYVLRYLSNIYIIHVS